MVYSILTGNSVAEHKCAFYSERPFFKTSIVAASLTSRDFCHTHGTDFFDYVDFPPPTAVSYAKHASATSMLSPKAVVLKPNLGTVQTK